MATALRQKSLILPREHGAWGLLLVPLATGASVGLLQGGNGGSLAPLTVAALALFWLRTPIESWMGTAPVRARAPGEIRLVRYAVALLAVVAAAALLWLFWGGRNRILLWIGAAAGLAFVGQATVRRFPGQQARMAAQMIGAAGLTATAPAGYRAVTGKGGGDAWFLWSANLLFAINQIHFVRLRIHAARRRTAARNWLRGADSWGANSCSSSC
jgi:YwiC-like protein